jgi:hypothetical protein
VKRVGKGWAITKEGREMDEWWWGRDRDGDGDAKEEDDDNAEAIEGGERAGSEEPALGASRSKGTVEEPVEVGPVTEIAGPPANEERPASEDLGNETLHDCTEGVADLQRGSPALPAYDDIFRGAAEESQESSSEPRTTLALHLQRSLPGQDDPGQQLVHQDLPTPSPMANNGDL